MSQHNSGHASMAALDRRLADILAAPKDHGRINTLCVRPAEGERTIVQKMALCPERGVVGDRWLHKTWIYREDGSPDPRIQVCILQHRVLDVVWRDRVNSPYPGDNLIVDMDLSEANLPIGQRLALGSAVIEVSDVFNNGCDKWHHRYGADALRWINRAEHRPLRLRGVLCQVVQAGDVTLGQRLTKVSG